MRLVKVSLNGTDLGAGLLRSQMVAEVALAFTRAIPHPDRRILSGGPTFTPSVRGWSLGEELHGRGQLGGLRVGRELACQSLTYGKQNNRLIFGRR